MERTLDHGQGKADILTDTDGPRHQGSDSHTQHYKDLTRAGQGEVGTWSCSPQDKGGTVEAESGAATKNVSLASRTWYPEAWPFQHKIKRDAPNAPSRHLVGKGARFIIRIRCTLRPQGRRKPESQDTAQGQNLSSSKINLRPSYIVFWRKLWWLFCLGKNWAKRRRWDWVHR